LSSLPLPRNASTPHRASGSPIVLAALFVLFALASLTFSTLAQAGEVHFDPESPAGKEYALPLPQARNEALGGGGAGPGGESGGGGGPTAVAAPLFGVGVGGRQSAGSDGEANGGGKQASQTDRGGGPDGKQAGGEGRQAVHIAAAEASGYSSGQALLMLVAILVLGIGLGFALRALSRQRPTPA
jgi:hypothetical protein